MKLQIIREIFTEKSTIGRMFVDDAELCYTLEDKDRRLEESGCSAKVYGQTCIPRGTYKVVIDYSNHFGKNMPHILDVNCFDGVRIHVGNRPEDSEGCILLGKQEETDFISHSADAFGVFMSTLQSGLAHGEVTLEII
jgi:hypothetical protein